MEYFDRIPPQKDDYFDQWKKRAKKTDYNNPYSAGQMIGMLFLIAVIERDDGIDKEFLQRLKTRCADKSADYFKKAPEDVLLMVEKMVGDL